jgi:hypothetical protein
MKKAKALFKTNFSLSLSVNIFFAFICLPYLGRAADPGTEERLTFCINVQREKSTKLF